MKKKHQNDTITKTRAWGFGEMLAIAAVRYCMGRRSYIVGVCIDWLNDIWDDLGEQTRNVILSDLEVEIDRERRTPGTLGMDCDVQGWTKLYKSLKERGRE